MTGKLKRRATFERLLVPAGDFEDTGETWEQAGEAYIFLEPLRGEELVSAQQISERVNYKATMNYSAATAALSSGYRMKVGDRTFNLTSVVNVGERNHWIEAMAIEVK